VVVSVLGQTNFSAVEASSAAIEGVTSEDRSYRGSRFSDVVRAVFANPYQQPWGDPREPALPVLNVTLRGVLLGVLSLHKRYSFRRATERVVDSFADLRWGRDRSGFRRLLHPNGICLTGLWEITEDSIYSGYFSKGSQALILGRYSTCCSETRRGHSRSLSLVGKLFPTTNADEAELLHPAHFITQQDIGGDATSYINDAELLNAPNTTVWRRGLGFAILLVTGAVFNLVDKKPSIRQLYQIAELGQNAGKTTRSPTFMRLLIAPDQPRIEGQQLDFRDEIMAQIYDRGDPAPKRVLTFNIEVTDEGETHGPAVFERRTFKSWRRIGKITFDKAVASYNGDFVIHFNHPTWRSDQNDPATATRVQGRKIR
jgi:hypothetical protein